MLLDTPVNAFVLRGYTQTPDLDYIVFYIFKGHIILSLKNINRTMHHLLIANDASSNYPVFGYFRLLKNTTIGVLLSLKEIH